MFEDVWYVAPPWLLDFLWLFLWGPVGGVVVAVLLFRFARWRPANPSLASVRYLPLSIDAINMANLRVMGGAGLALVLLCAIIAVYIPFIGLSLGTGLVVGLVAAVVLIAIRRKAGPVSSSSRALGAGTMLRLEERGGAQTTAGPNRDAK